MKPLYLTLLPVLGFGSGNDGGQCRDLADETAAGHRARWSGQYHRHHPTRRVRAALGAARPEHRRGEPCRRRRDNRLRLRRQSRSRWLYHPRPRLRAHDLAVALFEPGLRSGARFCGGRPVRDLAERPGCSAGKGWKTVGDLDRRSQSQTGRVELLLGRCRKRNPFERRALPAQRGGGGRACPVQGRR